MLMPPFQLRAMRAALLALIPEKRMHDRPEAVTRHRRRRTGHSRCRSPVSPSALGFEVATCSRGRDAIALIQARRPDLVMVDLRMPEVGGLDILRAIRDVDAHCQAVLMTGFASVDTAVEAVKLGAMDYLTKPLDFGRLEQLLVQRSATRSTGGRACCRSKASSRAASSSAA